MEDAVKHDLFAGINRSFKEHQASHRDFLAHRLAQRVIRKSIPITLGGAPLPRTPGDIPKKTHEVKAPIDKIGIIGSGVAGLYAAMILEDLGIPYEILEANERIGGRIFTYRFNGQAGKDAPVNNPARYDYFDVGAMRYPNIPFMDRVFDLFDRVGIHDLLIPYMLSSNNNLHYYNTQTPTINANATGDDYHVSVSQGGTVPDHYASQTADSWTSPIYQYYKDEIAKADAIQDPVLRAKAFQEAWDTLTKQDHFSTRGYMLAGKEWKPPTAPDPYPEAVVEWLETFDSATGLFDEAFVESVVDSLDFDYPNAKRIAKPLPPSSKKARPDLPDWVCIDGGSDRMIDGMLAKIQQQPKTGKFVSRIYESNGRMAVECENTNETFNYSQVICTAPLGCIGAMDLDGCGLLYNQKQAIRSLQYDASTKVGIKFQNRWWQDDQFMDGQPIIGGVSDTDVPIRVCVYPSYGLSCPPDQPPPGILLASYTWAQDARRMGALVQGHDSDAEKLLVNLVINNVAKLHNMPREKIPTPLDHFAHSWYNDQYTRGAFALFGPGQFGSQDSTPNGSMFMSLKAPTPNGMLHFAGEATSIHHAWVLGGLNSGWRAVYNALNGYEDLQKKLIANWGIPDEETEITLKCLTLLSRYRALK